MNQKRTTHHLRHRMKEQVCVSLTLTRLLADYSTKYYAGEPHVKHVDGNVLFFVKANKTNYKILGEFCTCCSPRSVPF